MAKQRDYAQRPAASADSAGRQPSGSATFRFTEAVFVLLTCSLWGQHKYANKAEETAIERVKTTEVSSLDGGLPKVTLEFFLSYEGEGAPIKWRVVDCDQLNENRSVEREQAPGKCVQADIDLKGDRSATIVVSVGTLKNGSVGIPAFFGATVNASGTTHAVRRLSDLPMELQRPPKWPRDLPLPAVGAASSDDGAAAGQNGLNAARPASMPGADFQTYRQQQTPGSALAHFRLGESFFEDRNFQAAANEFRAALQGEPHPNWIDAWAHIDLGEIFDATRQRDRAIREYRAAVGTRDDTAGAQGIATKGLDSGIDNPILHRVSSDFPDRMVDIPAEYSPEGRVAGLEGTVYLAGTVTADGSARDLHVVQPLGLGLEAAAIAAASQWKFEPARINGVPTTSSTTIRVNFLLKSRQSRWHLLRVAFAAPEGVSRPHFLNAPYPRGEGIGPAAADAARLLAAMGRQAVATLAFDVDEAGRPVRIRIQEASEPVWGEQAVSLVSRWQFSPAEKDDKPVSTPCMVDLVWGEKEFTPNTLRAAATETTTVYLSSHSLY